MFAFSQQPAKQQSANSTATPSIEWPVYRPLPPKLQYYGKYFSERFLGPRSTLDRHQIKALDNLVRWFGCTGTKFHTAVVVMPTAAGKMGVVCCLPFAIGGGIAREVISSETIHISKSILVITPGLNAIRLLEENLLCDPYLMRKDLLQEQDKEHNYTVHTVSYKTFSVLNMKTSQYDIILSCSQNWRKAKDGTPTYLDFPNDIFSMVIVDEAHLLPGKQWEEIVQKFKPHAKIVFFSATAKRSDRSPEVTTDSTLGTKGYTYKLTRVDAIQEKLMRDVQLTTLAPAEDTEEAKRTTYMQEVLVEVKRCLKVKNERSPLVGKHEHMAVILVKDPLEADEVRDICTKKCEFEEDSVKIMHSEDVPKEAINDTIKRIKTGDFKVVILDQTVLEEFDHPPISVAGIVTKLQSPVHFEHFVGRIQQVTQFEDMNVKANLITHKYFQQRELFARYVSPVIPVEEITNMDDPAK